MLINAGKYAGKTVELIVLTEPQYVYWLLNKDVSGPILKIKSHAQSLIDRFDAKPILNKICNAPTCSAEAKKMSLTVGSLNPYWWCSSCDPYSIGASYGTLQVVGTYRQALDHVQRHSLSPVSDSRELIRVLARSKGLPDKAGEPQARVFFATMLHP